MSEDYEQVLVASRAGWRRWLAEHHGGSPGVWAVTYKKESGEPYVPHAEVVEEALCFGWIDSIRRPVDGNRSRLLVTPRKAGSNWSRLNKQRVERLEREGLMRPSGRAAVKAAKGDGSWNALDEVEQLSEPEDLRRELDAQPRARAEWDAFPRSTKRAILEWIGSAKRPETRTNRVRETVEKAAVGIRANQWRQPRRAERSA